MHWDTCSKTGLGLLRNFGFVEQNQSFSVKGCVKIKHLGITQVFDQTYITDLDLILLCDKVYLIFY